MIGMGVGKDRIDTHGNVARLENRKGVVEKLTAFALVLLAGNVVALLDLLGASAVVTSIALPLHHLLSCVAVLVLELSPKHDMVIGACDQSHDLW